MGKILMLYQLALMEGKELDIYYDLLKSKSIYLLGVRERFWAKKCVFFENGTTKWYSVYF